MSEHLGVYEGYVVDNKDPEGLCRVRICVPNLLPDEGSDWAFPMGNPGAGTAKRGIWDAPEVGAEVYVMFLGGDPDKPRYLTGHWGLKEQVSAVGTAMADAGSPDEKISASIQVKSWETNEFNIVIDERPGKRRLYIHAKEMGQDLEGEALMIELDREQAVLSLSGIGGISIQSSGKISISAPLVEINGRVVSQATKAPI
jgi:uncharacterized protein involved in type VI secretion and phage assembly